jgi:hypothetical protein
MLIFDIKRKRQCSSWAKINKKRFMIGVVDNNGEDIGERLTT